MDSIDELIAIGSEEVVGADRKPEEREDDWGRAADDIAIDVRRRIFNPRALRTFVTQYGHDYADLVEGLIRDRSISLLVGDSNLGKTPLAIQMGVCISAGLPLFGRKVLQGRVLYCDAESNSTGFSEMLQALSGFQSLSEPPENFLVWSPNWETAIPGASTGDPQWGKALEKLVLEVRPRLVVVDPLRMFWPQAETKNTEAAEMITSLRNITKATQTSWLILHHRRKVNSQVLAPDLVENPHQWFQETAGAHALVNQSDTRLGVVPHPGQGDLMLAGLMRGSGPLAPLDLGRVLDDAGSAVGYKLLVGVEQLSQSDQQLYSQLPARFRFKDARQTIGGSSESNVARFLSKCCSVQVLRKEGQEYVKVTPPIVERVEYVE